MRQFYDVLVKLLQSVLGPGKGSYLLFFSLCTMAAYSQTSIGYTNMYYENASQEEDIFYSTSTGKYIYVAGDRYSAASVDWEGYIFQTDTSGNLNWAENLHAGTASSYGSGINYVYPDGTGVVTTGEFQSSQYPGGSPDCAHITRLDNSGNITFSEYFYSEAYSCCGGIYFDAAGGTVAQPISGGSGYYLLAAGTMGPGSTSGFAGGYEVGFDYQPYSDIWLIKTNTSGDSVWTQSFGLAYDYDYMGWGTVFGDSTRYDVPHGLAQGSDGLYISGTTTSPYYDKGGYPMSQMFVIKTNFSGVPQWAKTFYIPTGNSNYAGGLEYGFDICQVTGANAYLVSGYSVWTGDLVLMRIENTGTVDWFYEYNVGAGASSMGYTIRATADRNYIIGGENNVGTNGSFDMLMLEVDANGNVQKCMNYGGSSMDGVDSYFDFSSAVFPISTGSYGIASVTYSFGATNGGALVVKAPRSTFTSGGNGSGGVCSTQPTVTRINLSPGQATQVQIRSTTGTNANASSWPGSILTLRNTDNGEGVTVPIGEGTATWTTTNLTASVSTNQECLYALPIELVSFTAEYNANKGYTELQWETSSEKNNRCFFIERSTDGMNWETIDTTAGAGNSTANLYYSTLDHHPPIGTDYYRLVQEDIDGNRESFNIVPVTITAPGIAAIYPNPASTSVTIEDNDLSTVTIYNTLGQIICTSNAVNDKAVIDISGFADGIYIAQATDRVGHVTVLKFMKQGNSHGN